MMPDWLFGLLIGSTLGFVACVVVTCHIVGRMQADLFAALSQSPER